MVIDHARGVATVYHRAMQQGFGWDVPGIQALPPGFADFAHPISYRTSGTLVTEVMLPFVVPIPQVFQAETQRSYEPLPTMGHLLAAATADRKYVPAVQAMHEVVPLLVLALMMLPRASLPFPAFAPLEESPELHDLSARAAGWLVDALPSPALSGHPAEEELHRLVKRLLSRGNDFLFEPLAGAEDLTDGYSTPG